MGFFFTLFPGGRFPAGGARYAWLAVVAVLLLGAGFTSASNHTEGAFIRLDDFSSSHPPGETPDKWKFKKFKPIFGSGERTFFQFVHQGPERHYIQMASGRNNFFSLIYPREFHLKDWPVLEWEWKVTKLPKGGDVRNKKYDDQAGSLCVIFGLGTFSYDQGLCYFYENAGSKGEIQVHPQADYTRYALLRTGEADGIGKWYRERRDLMADYIATFGRPPGQKGLIVMQIDSDSTGTAAEIFYRNLVQRKK